MIHQILLAKIKDDLDTISTCETLMVEARIKLLRIPEIMNLKCGKYIVTKDNDYDFFVCIDFDNLAKMNIAHRSASFVQFIESQLKPRIQSYEVLDFEMEPGKDTEYS